MSIHSCQPCFLNWPLNQTPSFVTVNKKKKINQFKNASHLDENCTSVSLILGVSKVRF